MNAIPKQILVAGGAGFLGVNLCQSLLDQGHHVICLDSFVSGNPRHLEHLRGNPRFMLLEQDIIEPVSADVDEIYNLACVASPAQYQGDPIHTLRTSTEGVHNLLLLAIAKNARLLQTSTSEVYGNPHQHPQREEYFGNVNPIGPRACYDEGKRCAETLCMDFHRVHGASIKIARIFNTYGPFMDPHDGRVVSNFIVQALQDQPLTIYGDGSQTRSFCYVDDMTGGLQALMDSPDALTGPVNLGNPGEFTMLELAERVIELTNSASSVRFLPLPQDDPERRRPDISKARRLLGWEPKIHLEQGLIRTIAYFDRQLQEQQSLSMPTAQTGQAGIRTGGSL